MDERAVRVLHFGEFALDLARGCVRAGDQIIDLRPKAFEVLRHLAENAGRLVPKQELYQAVWPDVTVSDDSLVQCAAAALAIVDTGVCELPRHQLMADDVRVRLRDWGAMPMRRNREQQAGTSR